MDNFEEYAELLKRDRSIRRFDSSVGVRKADLERLVGLTRYCASARNLQPLRYRLVYSPDELDKVFPLLKWAGYLTDWDGPAENERPTAYLVQCLDTELTDNCLCDDGLQLQAITIGATAMGLGACIIKAFNAPELIKALNLPAQLKPLYVLALGHPAETVVIEDLPADGDYRYWRSPDQIHHVPKRQMNEIIID